MGCRQSDIIILSQIPLSIAFVFNLGFIGLFIIFLKLTKNAIGLCVLNERMLAVNLNN